MNLYSEYAKEFSNSRRAGWRGWDIIFKQKKILDKVQTKEVSILDLGCGNGRFLEWLLKQELLTCTESKSKYLEKYVGIDYYKPMLELADEKLAKFKNCSRKIKLIKQNLDSKSLKIKEKRKFDLVVLFGVMHHVKSFEARKKLIEQAFSRVKKRGFMIVSYWQFASNLKFLNSKKLNPDSVSYSSKLEEDDYILSFGKNGAFRFCHHFTNKEVNELTNNLNYNTKQSFNSDGKDDRMNLYEIIN